MITRVIRTTGGVSYLHVAIGVLTPAGARVDPTSAQVTFYRVSDDDGSLSADPDLGTKALTKQAGKLGFWGTAIDISDVDAGEFVVLAELTVQGVNTVSVDFLSLYEPAGGGEASRGSYSVVAGPEVDHE